MGFQFYQEQNIKNGLVDLLLSGFTEFPLYGEVKDFSMASVGLHFTLLYRLTGITPKDCQIPLLISPSDPLHSLLLPLFFTPQEQ